MSRLNSSSSDEDEEEDEGEKIQETNGDSIVEERTYFFLFRILEY
jgi:hypothetical protein